MIVVGKRGSGKFLMSSTAVVARRLPSLARPNPYSHCVAVRSGPRGVPVAVATCCAAHGEKNASLLAAKPDVLLPAAAGRATKNRPHHARTDVLMRSEAAAGGGLLRRGQALRARRGEGVRRTYTCPYRAIPQSCFFAGMYRSSMSMLKSGNFMQKTSHTVTKDMTVPTSVVSTMTTIAQRAQRYHLFSTYLSNAYLVVETRFGRSRRQKHDKETSNKKRV